MMRGKGWILLFPFFFSSSKISWIPIFDLLSFFHLSLVCINHWRKKCERERKC